MNEENRRMGKGLGSGSMSLEYFHIKFFKDSPFEDSGYAKVTHRLSIGLEMGCFSSMVQLTQSIGSMNFRTWVFNSIMTVLAESYSKHNQEMLQTLFIDY